MSATTSSERQAHAERYLDGLKGASPSVASSCPHCQRDFGFVGRPRALAKAVEEQEVIDEGGFSWNQCAVCGSRLGGNRYTWHAWTCTGSTAIDSELVHGTCCADCVAWLANGTPFEDEQ